MREREAFHVVEVVPGGCDGTEWLVRGRALDEVSVGDELHVDMPAVQHETARLVFSVAAITTYGKKTSGLSNMMSGDLLLRGAQGDLLQPNAVLYMGDEPRWPGFIERPLWDLSHLGFGLHPKSVEADGYVRAFAERWGGLDLDALVRAAEGTQGMTGADRLFMLAALGYTGAPPARELLYQLLLSDWMGDRWFGAIGLEEMGDRRSLPALGRMLVEGLPERWEDYVGSPRSFYEITRWELPWRLERLGDAAAAPALRQALVWLVRMLNQSTLDDSEQAALALARLDRRAMSGPEQSRAWAVFKGPRGTLPKRTASGGAQREAGAARHGLQPPHAARGEGEDWPITLADLMDFEGSLVYALGKLGALGALTDVPAARPFLMVWAVHILMAQVQDRYRLADSQPALSFALEADLRQHLQATFGLTSEEQEQALAWYMLARPAGVADHHPRTTFRGASPSYLRLR